MRKNHDAFFIDYKKLTLELPTEIELFNPADMDRYFKTFAIWDTGATISCISPNALIKLGLEPIDSIMIEGINSLERCDQVLVHIGLPNMILVQNIKPAVCIFSPPDLEFIIGMDIIKTGDFMLSNSNGKSLFSFATPPLPIKINLVDYAQKINNEN
ncbi:MAG: retroviral-like aspartic protease family protein [Treponema sp.]|nr:retroviral-like aspartic protease family protein [Treponema sp.]